jgi:broad specificity phosphatase PhoE
MLILVRHSERLDEVDEREWQQFVVKKLRTENCQRNPDSFHADPPITPNGKLIAEHAGTTLQNLLHQRHSSEERTSPLRIRIYSSRLLRCLQTSIRVAKKLNIREIYISSGLALTAAAVDRLGSAFEFLTVEEIEGLCVKHGIQVHNCDEEGREYSISSSHWFDALQDVSNHAELDYKITVCHRETIRNLLPIYPKLPYCCIALCHYQQFHKGSNEVSLGISTIFDHKGGLLKSFNPEEIAKRKHHFY